MSFLFEHWILAHVVQVLPTMQRRTRFLRVKLSKMQWAQPHTYYYLAKSYTLLDNVYKDCWRQLAYIHVCCLTLLLPPACEDEQLAVRYDAVEPALGSSSSSGSSGKMQWRVRVCVLVCVRQAALLLLLLISCVRWYASLGLSPPCISNQFLPRFPAAVAPMASRPSSCKRVLIFCPSA